MTSPTALTLPMLPPSPVTMPDRPSNAADRYPAAADGRIVMRWDPSLISKDHALRLTVNGTDHEIAHSVGGRVKGERFSVGAGYAPSYRLNDFDRLVKGASDAMVGIAASRGGSFEAGRTYAVPEVIVSGKDIANNPEVHARKDIPNGSFELSVLRPGAADDLFLRGRLGEIDSYPGGIAEAVRAAQALAAGVKD